MYLQTVITSFYEDVYMYDFNSMCLFEMYFLV